MIAGSLLLNFLASDIHPQRYSVRRAYFKSQLDSGSCGCQFTFVSVHCSRVITQLKRITGVSCTERYAVVRLLTRMIAVQLWLFVGTVCHSFEWCAIHSSLPGVRVQKASLDLAGSS